MTTLNRSTSPRPYTGTLDKHEIQLKRLPGVDIYKTSVGGMDNNTYLLVDTQSESEGVHPSILIDAANDPEFLRDFIESTGSEVKAIVTTHSHFDHVQALPQIARTLRVPTIASSGDAAEIPVPPDRTVTQGDRIDFGSQHLDVISLRGHTAEGIALALTVPLDAVSLDAVSAEESSTEFHIFSGDSLFPGGVGRTESPESFRQLIDDVSTRVINAYPDSSRIYPGHGSDTTVGAERPHIPSWIERGW